MKKREFYFDSKDGRSKIHAIEWVPEGDVTAVLQICHGMVDYADRYDAFASYLAERGIAVVGHDHIGHGKSVADESEFGHFPPKKGNQYVVGDIHTLRLQTEKRFPGVPYFMLGHSMGSFLVRQYLTMRSKGIAGAIVMGTGNVPYPLLVFGQIVCRLIGAVKGSDYRSEFVNRLGMGSYNLQFEPSESTKDWITSDDAMREKYEADPFCSFIFTVSGYDQMFEGMKKIVKKESPQKIDKDVPVLFVSGSADPVGDNGKSVEKVYEMFCEAGIRDVQIKLYENKRHELLNEKDRDVVFRDLHAWILERIVSDAPITD